MVCAANTYVLSEPGVGENPFRHPTQEKTHGKPNPKQYRKTLITR
jgi:hypothetical protein